MSIFTFVVVNKKYRLLRQQFLGPKRLHVQQRQKIVLTPIVSIGLITATPSVGNADLFGGDVVVLSQILIQTIEQLIQLKRIYDNARGQLDMIKDINSGIDEALGNLDSRFRNFDPKSYRDWKSVQGGLKTLQNLYGKVPDSVIKGSQKISDIVVSEALTLNSNILEKVKSVQRSGEKIKQRANKASPKGASKVTAEGVGVMVHLMNQQLKAQGQQLKISAQDLALKNAEDKKETTLFLNSSKELKSKMKSFKGSFKTPRF